MAHGVLKTCPGNTSSDFLHKSLYVLGPDGVQAAWIPIKPDEFEHLFGRGGVMSLCRLREAAHPVEVTDVCSNQFLPRCQQRACKSALGGEKTRK